MYEILLGVRLIEFNQLFSNFFAIVQVNRHWKEKSCSIWFQALGRGYIRKIMQNQLKVWQLFKVSLDCPSCAAVVNQSLTDSRLRAMKQFGIVVILCFHSQHSLSNHNQTWYWSSLCGRFSRRRGSGVIETWFSTVHSFAWIKVNDGVNFMANSDRLVSILWDMPAGNSLLNPKALGGHLFFNFYAWFSFDFTFMTSKQFSFPPTHISFVLKSLISIAFGHCLCTDQIQPIN